MARRIRTVESDPAGPPTDADLHRRLTNLYRGATAYLMLDRDDPRYETEKAAAQAFADADDERRPLAERVHAREALLGQMGPLDRALRHVASMEAARARWGERGR